MKFLITGAPGSGKTTLLKKISEGLGERAGGMLTEEIREQGVRKGFTVVDIATGEKATLAHVDFKSPYRVGRYCVDIDTLERVGVKAVERALKEKEVIIIDEIAPMELYSKKFIEVVRKAFSSQKSVIATFKLNLRHELIDEVKGTEIFILRRDERYRILHLLKKRIESGEEGM